MVGLRRSFAALVSESRRLAVGRLEVEADCESISDDNDDASLNDDEVLFDDDWNNFANQLFFFIGNIVDDEVEVGDLLSSSAKSCLFSLPKAKQYCS